MTEKDDILKRTEGLLMLGINAMLRSLNKEDLARVTAKFMEHCAELSAFINMLTSAVENPSPKAKLLIKSAKALAEKTNYLFDEIINEQKAHDQRN